MTKKITDIQTVREIKDAKTVMNNATKDLMSMTIAYQELKLENETLKEKIKHLEIMLKESSNIPDLSRKSHEEEIILVELKRMWDTHVSGNEPLTDRQDIKKLETLVKCLVSLRNGQPKESKKEKEMSIEDALRIVKDEIN